MITNWGKTRIPLYLAGSHTTLPTHFMIGSGSGTALATQTELLFPSDRQAITAANGSTAFKVKFTGDWSSITISGVALQNLFEWGMCIDKAGVTGSMWSRTSMPNVITFDGTSELRIEENWEVY